MFSDLSHILTPVGLSPTVPDFRALTPNPQPVFSGNYSEAATRDLDEDVEDNDAIAEHYGYDSDSDLEDAEEPPPLRGHPFDPFCFVPAESGDPESNHDGTTDGKPQDTIWYS